MKFQNILTIRHWCHKVKKFRSQFILMRKSNFHQSSLLFFFVRSVMAIFHSSLFTIYVYELCKAQVQFLVILVYVHGDGWLRWFQLSSQPACAGHNIAAWATGTTTFTRVQQLITYSAVLLPTLGN